MINNNKFKEPINLGIGETNHKWLDLFKENNVFSEMRDAYRFAFSYAVFKNIQPDEIMDTKVTVFSRATIDPEEELYTLIDALYPELEVPRYQILERLANSGMTELVKLYKSGQLDLTFIVEEASGA